MTELKTKAEQRIARLVNCGRPLTEHESDELYRALHADYMRKWRAARAEQMEREAGRFAATAQRKEEKLLLQRAYAEAGW